MYIWDITHVNYFVSEQMCQSYRTGDTLAADNMWPYVPEYFKKAFRFNYQKFNSASSSTTSSVRR